MKNDINSQITLTVNRLDIAKEIFDILQTLAKLAINNNPISVAISQNGVLRHGVEIKSDFSITALDHLINCREITEVSARDISIPTVKMTHDDVLKFIGDMSDAEIEIRTSLEPLLNLHLATMLEYQKNRDRDDFQTAPSQEYEGMPLSFGINRKLHKAEDDIIEVVSQFAKDHQSEILDCNVAYRGYSYFVWTQPHSFPIVHYLKNTPFAKLKQCFMMVTPNDTCTFDEIKQMTDAKVVCKVPRCLDGLYYPSERLGIPEGYSGNHRSTFIHSR